MSLTSRPHNTSSKKDGAGMRNLSFSSLTTSVPTVRRNSSSFKEPILGRTTGTPVTKRRQSTTKSLSRTSSFEQQKQLPRTIVELLYLEGSIDITKTSYFKDENDQLGAESFLEAICCRTEDRYNLLNFFLNQGCPVKKSQTPHPIVKALHSKTINEGEYLKTIKLLAKSSVNPGEQIYFNKTNILDIAFLYGTTSSVKLIIEIYGEEVITQAETPIWFIYSLIGAKKKLKKYLHRRKKNGDPVNVNTHHPLSHVLESDLLYRSTPLLCACNGNHFETISVLLHYGASLGSFSQSPRFGISAMDDDQSTYSELDDELTLGDGTNDNSSGGGLDISNSSVTSIASLNTSTNTCNSITITNTSNNNHENVNQLSSSNSDSFSTQNLGKYLFSKLKYKNLSLQNLMPVQKRRELSPIRECCILFHLESLFILLKSINNDDTHYIDKLYDYFIETLLIIYFRSPYLNRHRGIEILKTLASKLNFQETLDKLKKKIYSSSSNNHLNISQSSSSTTNDNENYEILKYFVCVFFDKYQMANNYLQLSINGKKSDNEAAYCLKACVYLDDTSLLQLVGVRRAINIKASEPEYNIWYQAAIHNSTPILEILFDVNVPYDVITGRLLLMLIYHNQIEFVKKLLQILPNTTLDKSYQYIKLPKQYKTKNNQIQDSFITNDESIIKILEEEENKLHYHSSLSCNNYSIDYNYYFIHENIYQDNRTDKSNFEFNFKKPKNITPLQLACKLDRFEIIEILIDNGASVDYFNDNGISNECPYPPLFLAVSYSKLEVILYLIECKANINIKIPKNAKQNLSIIQNAIVRVNIPAIELLLSKKELNLKQPSALAALLHDFPYKYPRTLCRKYIKKFFNAGCAFHDEVVDYERRVTIAIFAGCYSGSKPMIDHLWAVNILRDQSLFIRSILLSCQNYQKDLLIYLMSYYSSQSKNPIILNLINSLQIAIRTEQVEIVDFLLNNSYSSKIIPKINDQEAIDYSIEKLNFHLFKVLQKYSTLPSTSSYQFIVKCRNNDIHDNNLILFFNAMKEINATELLFACLRYGNSKLDDEMIELIKDPRVSINTHDDTGQILTLICYQNHKNILLDENLSSTNSNPIKTSNDNNNNNNNHTSKTPRCSSTSLQLSADHHQSINCNRKIIKLLELFFTRTELDINLCQNSHGKHNLLFTACYHGDYDVAKLILDFHSMTIQFNLHCFVDQLSITPIYAACLHYLETKNEDALKVVELLLPHVDPTVVNQSKSIYESGLRRTSITRPRASSHTTSTMPGSNSDSKKSGSKIKSTRGEGNNNNNNNNTSTSSKTTENQSGSLRGENNQIMLLTPSTNSEKYIHQSENPLHLACSYGCSKLIDILSKKYTFGTSVDLMTPALYLVSVDKSTYIPSLGKYDFPLLTKYLSVDDLKKQSILNIDALSIAVYKNNVLLLDYLLKRGLDPNRKGKYLKFINKSSKIHTVSEMTYPICHGATLGFLNIVDRFLTDSRLNVRTSGENFLKSEQGSPIRSAYLASNYLICSKILFQYSSFNSSEIISDILGGDSNVQQIKNIKNDSEIIFANLIPSMVKILNMQEDQIPTRFSQSNERKIQYLYDLAQGQQEFRRLRVIIVGPAAAGKTTIVKRLVGDLWNGTQLQHFNEAYEGYLGNNLKNKAVLNNQLIKNDKKSSSSSSSSSSSKNKKTKRKGVTDGIDVHFWKPKDQNVAISLWDFAGQEIYYTTHQFFLAPNTLYLIVFNAALPLKHGNIVYWLNSIQSRVKGQQVLIIATHIDKMNSSKRNQRLQELNDEIKNIYHRWMYQFEPGEDVIQIVSQKDNDMLIWPVGKKETLEHIESAMIYSAEQRNPIPSKYMLLRSRINQLRSHDSIPIIEKSKLDEIAKEFGIDSRETSSALELLHEWGEVMYFSNGWHLSKKIILDPRWLSNLFKTVSSFKFSSREGNYTAIISISELKKRWRDANFSPDLDMFLIELLEYFQIMVKAPNENGSRYIVPSLLRSSPPPDYWIPLRHLQTRLKSSPTKPSQQSSNNNEINTNNNPLHLQVVEDNNPATQTLHHVYDNISFPLVEYYREYHLPFSPHGLISRLLAHFFILGQRGDIEIQYFWETGIVLFDKIQNVHILVTLEDDNQSTFGRIVEVVIRGPSPHWRTKMAFFHSLVTGIIFDWYPGIRNRISIYVGKRDVKGCIIHVPYEQCVDNFLLNNINQNQNQNQSSIMEQSSSSFLHDSDIIIELLPELTQPIIRWEQGEFQNEDLSDSEIKFNREIQIIKKLGGGMFGNVFKAKWNDKLVAVKTLSTDSPNRDDIMDFCKEVAILKALDHPCIVKLLYFFPNPMAIVTELITGGDLEEAIKTHYAQITWEVLTKILLDVCRALVYMHSFSPPIYHNDIKVANILVIDLHAKDPEIAVKVADVGCARMASLIGGAVSSSTASKNPLTKLDDFMVEEQKQFIGLLVDLFEAANKGDLHPCPDPLHQIFEEAKNDKISNPFFPNILKRLEFIKKTIFNDDHENKIPLKDVHSKMEQLHVLQQLEGAMFSNQRDMILEILSSPELHSLGKRGQRLIHEIFMDVISKDDAVFFKDLLNTGAWGTNTFLNDSHSYLIHSICSFGYEDLLKILLDKKVDLESIDPLTHCTALHIAVEKNHPNIVQLLLANFANVNAVNGDNLTAAMIAAKNAHVDCLQHLLRMNVDANTGYSKRYDPSSNSSSGSSSGLSGSSTDLHSSSPSSSTTDFSLCVKHSPRLHKDSPRTTSSSNLTSSTDGKRSTLLIFAIPDKLSNVQSKHRDCVKCLLEHGASRPLAASKEQLQVIMECATELFQFMCFAEPTIARQIAIGLISLFRSCTTIELQQLQEQLSLVHSDIRYQEKSRSQKVFKLLDKKSSGLSIKPEIFEKTISEQSNQAEIAFTLKNYTKNDLFVQLLLPKSSQFVITCPISNVTIKSGHSIPVTCGIYLQKYIFSTAVILVEIESSASIEYHYVVTRIFPVASSTPALSPRGKRT